MDTYNSLPEKTPYEICLPDKITYNGRLIRRAQFVMDSGYIFLQMLPERDNVVIYLRNGKKIPCKEWLNSLFGEKDKPAPFP